MNLRNSYYENYIQLTTSILEPYQFFLGHVTVVLKAECVRRQLQTQRAYFLPGGGGPTGCMY